MLDHLQRNTNQSTNFTSTTLTSRRKWIKPLIKKEEEEESFRHIPDPSHVQGQQICTLKQYTSEML